MKRDFDRVGRWEQTEDVLQNASLRLYEALGQVELTDVRHFYRLAALQIRRELIDLARHYQGPLGMGANHATARAHHPDQSAAAPLFDRAEFSADPQQIQQWGDFHLQVERLPDREREVFELLWYHELPQDEVAELLGLSTRQVKRIWRTAKLKLHDSLADRDTD
jgi:RNA polymerase sigma-70 factor (ECF subfamily)